MFCPVTSIARWAAYRPVTAVLRLENPVTAASQRPVDDDRPGSRPQGPAAPGVVPHGRRRVAGRRARQGGLDGAEAGGHERPVALPEGAELAGQHEQGVAVLDQDAGPRRLDRCGELAEARTGGESGLTGGAVGSAGALHLDAAQRRDQLPPLAGREGEERGAARREEQLLAFEP